jgi:hypothetical protein
MNSEQNVRDRWITGNDKQRHSSRCGNALAILVVKDERVVRIPSFARKRLVNWNAACPASTTSESRILLFLFFLEHGQKEMPIILRSMPRP